MRGSASHLVRRGPTFRLLISWYRLCTAIGEPTQRGDARDRRYGVEDVITCRDKRFELRQYRVHRPDRRLGQREVAFCPIDGLVEALGGCREILDAH
ncbi:MAG: hypothetical protein QOF31_1849 [Mycobacterium sp.]|nr:hypothetical protein [Mycobacterium sp.]